MVLMLAAYSVIMTNWLSFGVAALSKPLNSTPSTNARVISRARSGRKLAKIIESPSSTLTALPRIVSLTNSSCSWRK